MKKPLVILAALLAASCGDQGGGENAAPKTPEEAGRIAFRECAVCHTTREGEPNRIGPNLSGVYGRQAGARGDFSYSKALQDADFVWNDETLDAYIENPQKFLRGNRMAYAGQADAEKRGNIIAYLKTLQPANE